MSQAARSRLIGAEPHGGPIQTFSLKPGTPRRPTIARGEGIFLWDTDGRRYVDVSSGPVATNLGHGNKRVIAAIHAQADKVTFAHPTQFENEPNVALSEMVTRLAGPGLERAWFCSGGSEAVESAVKFARHHAVVTGQGTRWKVISRMPAYHGSTLGALALTGDEVSHKVYGPLINKMPKVPTPFTYRVPDNHTAESYARHCAADVERTIIAEGPETILAFVLEPIGGLATGALVTPAVYLETVREICTRHGVLLIYDEVISGAGRTGTFLGADHWPKARPDMVILAKGLAAGYAPLGAVLAPARMVEAVATSGGFMHGHTYLANPMSCAVGCAAVTELMERDLIANARRMGDHLRTRLEALKAKSPLVGDVRGKGLLSAVEIVADKATKAMLPLELMAPNRFQALALEDGLLVYCRRTNGGRDGDWIMTSPPLIVTESEIDMIVDGLERVFRRYEAELRGQGVKIG